MEYKNIFPYLFLAFFLGCVPHACGMEQPLDKQAKQVNNILWQACLKGNVGLVKYLIEKGADVNVEINDNVTPLYIACEQGNLSLVKYLMEQGADIQKGRFPLHAACQQGHCEVAKYLVLEKQADVNVIDCNKSSTLHKSCLFGNQNLPIIKMLIEQGARVNVEGYDKWTPLHMACELGFYEVAYYLIEQGANINAEDSDNITPLQATCLGEIPNHLIIKLLLEKGVDIDAEACNKNTVLHTACEKGFYKTVKYLIKEGASINVKNIYGVTPLIFVVLGGRLDLIELLIQNKADINVKTCQLFTVLHAAAYTGQTQVVQYLLKKASELIDAETDYGFTALDLAYAKKHESIVKLFKQHGIRTISEQDAEKNMRALFAELDEETRQVQAKRGQKNQKKSHNKNNGHSKQAVHKNVKNKTNTNRVTSNQKATLVGSDTIQSRVPDTSTETMTKIISSSGPLITISHVTSSSNGSDEPSNICSPVCCINSSSVSKKTIEIIAKKQDSDIQIVSKKPAQSMNQLRALDNEYQIGHDIKLKWPRSLNGAQYTMMRDHLKQLKHWPEVSELDIKLLKGQSGLYRLRVGGYRVIFKIDEELRRIIICEIGLRKKVYRGLQY